MKLITKITLGTLALILLNSHSLFAQNCPTGNPNSLAYILRDNNRCEGIKERLIGTRYDLIAFSIGNLNNYPEILKIRVPGTGKTPPEITIESYVQNYLLDQVKTDYISSEFIFNLPTKNVLQEANIPPESLRAIAYITRNSRELYFPVILSKPTNYYQFVIYSTEPRIFTTVQIHRNGKVIPSNLKPSNIPRKGEISFQWQYGNAKAGTYELYLKDNKGQERSFYFEHNPQWLR